MLRQLANSRYAVSSNAFEMFKLHVFDLIVFLFLGTFTSVVEVQCPQVMLSARA